MYECTNNYASLKRICYEKLLAEFNNKTMKKFINIFNRTIDALAAIKKNIRIQFLKLQTELQKETNTLLKKRLLRFLYILKVNIKLKFRQANV